MKPKRLITTHVGHKVHSVHENYLLVQNAYFQDPTIDILILSFHDRAWNRHCEKIFNEPYRCVNLKNGNYTVIKHYSDIKTRQR